jgi:hypothetical protein
MNKEIDLFIGKKIAHYKCDVFAENDNDLIKCKNFGKFCKKHCPSYSHDNEAALNLVLAIAPLCVDIHSIYGESFTCRVRDSRRGENISEWAAFNKKTIPEAIAVAVAQAWNFGGDK